MLYHIIYFSKAARQMRQNDLIFLLKQSRDWNKEHHLTGMLVYLQGGMLSKDDGRFMQVIEGTKQEIDFIFDKIKQDSRHRYVTVIQYGAIQQRDFETWQMGFEAVEVTPQNQVKGYFELNDDFLKSTEFKKSNMALNFLKSFYSTDTRLAG